MGKAQSNLASGDTQLDSWTMEDIFTVQNVAFDAADEAASENPGDELLNPHGR